MINSGVGRVNVLIGFINLFLQLAGTAVLAIGLWLRFDVQTKSIFELESNNMTFYTGKLCNNLMG